MFQAGSGLEILVLHLELDVPDEAIRWAEGVLKANRGRPAILVTHAYLVDRDKARGRRPYLRAGGNSAEQLWDKLIRRTPQIFMVLCGHYARPGEYHQVSANDSGGQVIEIIADYQFRPNGGDGWLTLLWFDTQAGRIQGKTYSPWLDRYETDADSQFDFPFPAPLRLTSGIPPSRTLVHGD